MALIDVSDVLDDPDFTTTVDVMRSTQTVAATGIASDAAEPIDTNVVAVVEPASTFELQRMPEGERLKGAINIWTRYPLSDGRGNEEAHIVFWNNAHYTVVSLDDWTQYGSGYTKAMAVLLDINV